MSSYISLFIRNNDDAMILSLIIPLMSPSLLQYNLHEIPREIL